MSDYLIFFAGFIFGFISVQTYVVFRQLFIAIKDKKI